MQQFQRLFVRLQYHREIGFAARSGGDTAIESLQQAADHGKFQRFQIQHEGVFLLSHLIHAHGGGLHADEGDVDQITHRGRRVTVAVNELVQHIGGVLRGLDGGNALVSFDAPRAVRDILFRDEGVHPQVHKTIALVPLDRLAPCPGNGLSQHFNVEVVAHGFHVAVLAVPQQTARAADLQIPHGDAEARAESGKLPDGGKPLLGDIGQGLVPAEGEVGVGFAAGAPHPPTDLVQLCQTHAVGVLNDEGVAVAHINAGLDKGGADQNVDLAVQQVLPHGVQLFFGHLAVGNAYPRTRHHLADMGGAGFNVVHPVVQVVHLPAPGKFFLHGFGKDDIVIFQHKGLHRLALDGRLLDGGKIPDAAHCHVQCAGDGGSRQGEHIHPDEVLLQLFLVLHAKALFLVDDDKTEVVELYVLGQQPVGAHHDIHAAGL